jgi:hypothetical protein
MSPVRLLICLAAIAAAEPACGQPISTHYDSIEWMVADSTVVVRGTIVDVQTEREGEYGEWQIVTVRTDELLKGEKPTALKFAVDASGSRDRISQWHKNARPLIMFLDESRKLAARFAGVSGLTGRRLIRFPLAPRTGYVKDSFLELTPDSRTPAFSWSLRPIEKPDDLLQAVKAAIAESREPGPLFACSIRLPEHGNMDFLSVPVDPRLEAAALRWIGSKQFDYRTEGAKALLYFQSPANAELLKRLLNDPDFVTLVKEEKGRTVNEARIFEVREAAWQVLEAWGVEVPRPVIREPISAKTDR